MRSVLSAAEVTFMREAATCANGPWRRLVPTQAYARLSCSARTGGD